MNKFWNFKLKDEAVGELFLYGEIASESWWGDEVTPTQFKADLDALGDIGTLNVYVNSAGGDIFAAWAIVSILQRHSAKKIGYNDGMAASAAFCILMSMDEVVAMENSFFMTHNCWTYTCGNRFDLEKQIQLMESIDNTIAEMTVKRTGEDIETIKEYMDAETWWTAQEAADLGICDSVYEAKPIAACCTKEMLARYKNAPQIPTVDDEPVIDEPVEPVNGDESQPVEDINPALDEQRKHFMNVKRKILGGTK